MKVITLTTDFGLTNEYVATMKGVILNINPQATIIDITHSIQPQNIHQGAYILHSAVKYYHDAIHVGVIDPGVGTERAGLIIKCGSGSLVGPDNGLLVPAAESMDIEGVFQITNYDLCLEDISSTFHGRDIFAPVAAHLATGTTPQEIGERITKYKKLDLLRVSETEDKITGQILNIDHFGNIITNLPLKLIAKHFELNELVTISTTNEKGFKVPYKNTYANVPKGTLLALISSSGFLELAGNQCSANEKLNLKISDMISIQKS